MKKPILTFIIICITSVCFGAEYSEQRDNTNTLIGYTRTSDGASIPIAQDNRDYRDVLAWIALGNILDPDPAILNKVKQAKRAEYKSEAVRRIGLQVSAWGNYETVALIASLWNMLGTASAAQTIAKDIYLYVKTTVIPNVNAQTDVASVMAIDVVNDVNWP